jgi:hypothetical protein
MTAEPIGTCLWCGESILPFERHEFRAHGGTPPTMQPLHQECLLRMALGSVGHQKGTCSCHGGTEEDPPEMTKRQAAVAAWVYAAEVIPAGW